MKNNKFVLLGIFSFVLAIFGLTFYFTSSNSVYSYADSLTTTHTVNFLGVDGDINFTIEVNDGVSLQYLNDSNLLSNSSFLDYTYDGSSYSFTDWVKFSTYLTLTPSNNILCVNNSTSGPVNLQQKFNFDNLGVVNATFIVCDEFDNLTYRTYSIDTDNKTSSSVSQSNNITAIHYLDCFYGSSGQFQVNVYIKKESTVNIKYCSFVLGSSVLPYFNKDYVNYLLGDDYVYNFDYTQPITTDKYIYPTLLSYQYDLLDTLTDTSFDCSTATGNFSNYISLSENYSYFSILLDFTVTRNINGVVINSSYTSPLNDGCYCLVKSADDSSLTYFYSQTLSDTTFSIGLQKYQNNSSFTFYVSLRNYPVDSTFVKLNINVVGFYGYINENSSIVSGSYNNGYSDGYHDGYYSSRDFNPTDYYNIGYADGYYTGGNGADLDYTIKNGFFAILDAPFNVLKNALNFSIFGINLSTFVITLLSLVVLFWVINKFKSN